MKRLKAIIFAVITGLGSSVAQTHLHLNATHIDGNALMMQGPRTEADAVQHRAPMKASLEDNQRIMGACQTDNLSENGFGLPQFPGTMRIATVLPAWMFSKFNGATITAMRIGLTASPGTVKGFVAPIDGEGNILQDLTTGSTGQAQLGWNQFNVTPAVINAEGLAGFAIGYEYQQLGTKAQGTFTADCYPISIMKTTFACNTLAYGNLGNGLLWYDLGQLDLGNIAVQCIVQSDNLPEKEVIITNLQTAKPLYKRGEELAYSFFAENFGTKPVEQTSIDISLNGQVVKNIKTGLQPSEISLMEGTVTLGDDISTGNITLSATAYPFNGEELQNTTGLKSAAVAAGLYSEAETMARQKYLVEEMTSASMEESVLADKITARMKELYNDVAFVTIHYKGTWPDPLETEESFPLMNLLDYYALPTAALNRTYIGNSPNDGKYGLSTYLGYAQYQSTYAKRFYNQMEASSVEPLATLSIGATTADNLLTVKVSGKGTDKARAIMEGRTRLSVYITEDQVVSRQRENGAWNNEYLHNDVLRKMLTATRGDMPQWTADDTFENTFSLQVPEQWQKDRLHVVAFIHLMPSAVENNFRNMGIINAETVQPVEATAISTASADSHRVACYTIDGRKVTEPNGKGIYIVKMSNGQTRKILSK